MAETLRGVRARAGKAAEREDGWGNPSFAPMPDRPSSSHTLVCPVGGPRPRPRHLPCALGQDFEPRIHLADADFAALTAGGSLCDSEGALGPGEFDAAMRRQATCTRCACSGRCCTCSCLPRLLRILGSPSPVSIFLLLPSAAYKLISSISSRPSPPPSIQLYLSYSYAPFSVPFPTSSGRRINALSLPHHFSIHLPFMQRLRQSQGAGGQMVFHVQRRLADVLSSGVPDEEGAALLASLKLLLIDRQRRPRSASPPGGKAAGSGLRPPHGKGRLQLGEAGGETGGEASGEERFDLPAEVRAMRSELRAVLAAVAPPPPQPPTAAALPVATAVGEGPTALAAGWRVSPPASLGEAQVLWAWTLGSAGSDAFEDPHRPLTSLRTAPQAALIAPRPDSAGLHKDGAPAAPATSLQLPSLHTARAMAVEVAAKADANAAAGVPSRAEDSAPAIVTNANDGDPFCCIQDPVGVHCGGGSCTSDMCLASPTGPDCGNFYQQSVSLDSDSGSRRSSAPD